MTKIDGRSKEEASKQIDESLRRLQPDHVDLLQHHEVIRYEDADRIFAAVPDSGLPRPELIGIPLRQAIASLDRPALRAQAREHFGLDPAAPTLLVTGGSQGARALNTAVSGAAAELGAAGIGVLHAHGRRNTVEVAVVPGPLSSCKHRASKERTN